MHRVTPTSPEAFIVRVFRDLNKVRAMRETEVST
jgi:hypothetical protein